MKRDIRRWICLVSLVCCCTVCVDALDTSAASAVLTEQKSGRILYEQDARQQRLIASITKIITAVVALEHGDLSAEYTVTERDMAEGSSMYLRPGEVLTLEELLYGLMLASGNDAALAVAHCVSGSEEDFVALMNDTARRLEMHQSSFANPNGLDAPDHHSTAADMAILTAYALENETFRRIVSTAGISIGQRQLSNHNKLLGLYDGCIGVKTGYTKAAGRTLVSAAQREDMTLICVTLSDGNDWNDHTALLDYGFSAFSMVTPMAAGEKLASVLVRGGNTPLVGLMAAKDLCYPLTQGESLEIVLRVPVSVPAPVIPGQVIGRISAYLNGEEVAAADLIAMQPSAAVQAETDEAGGRFFKLFGKKER